MAKQGYVKLYRSIQENDIWMKNEPFDKRSAWIDLILLANHEEKTIYFNKGTLKIDRGQFHTSIYKLANRWHWSRPRTVLFLDTLTELGMITTKRTTNGTTVSIVNYSKFQDVRATNVTTDITKDITTNITTDLTTNVTQTRSKEDKNKRSKEKKKASPLYKHSDKPGWRVEDGYEYWIGEDEGWEREKITG